MKCFKKGLAICFVLASSCGLFAVDLSRTAAEMNDAYESGFFPGVVRYADVIISEDSNSMYAGQAFVYKGECLFRMGRLEECLASLADGKKLAKDNKELTSALNYWEGRCYFEMKSYEKAQASFFASASGSSRYYADSILFGARSYKAVNDFENAAVLYKYVIASGKSYNQDDYEKSVTDLLNVYNQDKKYQDALNLALQLENADFTSYTKNSILLEKGDAFNGLGKYSAAYDCYCKVLAEGPSTLAAVAMQKAYYVSSSHKSEVGKEPGAIITQAQGRLAQYPELLDEFWTRLAIDAFYGNDYAKAREYFRNAQNSTNTTLIHLAAIYKSEMELNSGKGTEKSRAENAEKILDAITVTENDELYYSVNLCYARTNAMKSEWEKSRSFAETVIKAEDLTVKRAGEYWYILSFYQKNDIKTSYSLVKDKNYDSRDFMLLKAKILAKSGYTSQADKIFYELGTKGQLDNDGRLDYTRTLLNGGHLISAGEQSGLAKGAEADYMAGLALFNRGKWNDAAAKFSRCVNENELSKEHRGYARFYLGYCQYRTEEYDKSSANLKLFVTDYQNHPLFWNGCETGAKSAVQAGKFNEAFPLAEKAVRYARTQSEKESSVLLCAGIYADASRYDDAVKTLSPYADKKDSFAYECRYKIAQIQTQKKDYAAAEGSYLKLANERAGNQYADESLYRYAELSYTQAQISSGAGRDSDAREYYSEAAKRFDNYCNKWVNGKFYVAAQYFAADCYAKTGSSVKAKLYYEQIVENPDAGTYRYGSQKELVYIYKNIPEYDKAVKVAEAMISEYGEQSRNDGIPEVLSEIRLLSKGGDYGILSKKTQFDNSNGEKTAAGRKTGTELAAMYMSANMTDEAEKMASRILAANKKNIKSEYDQAAANAELLGKIRRSKTENKKAAESYLEAAGFYRNCGNEEAAARCLYGAAECFDAAGLYGDSKAVIENMTGLYPDSNWTKNALNLNK